MHIKTSVLIADDNNAMREVIRKFTEKYFESIYECSDGGEAIQCFYTHQPDLVLMDIKMKTMDGITATQHIIQHFPSAKLLLLPTTVMNRCAMPAKAGGVGYILKENLQELNTLFLNHNTAQSSF